MSYLPTSKFGDCTQCPSKQVPCVKVGKNLVCIPCNNSNKAAKQISKAKEKQKILRSLSSLKQLPENKEMVVQHESKSDLLKKADNLFSLFIRERDADKNRNIQCVCCGKVYNLDQVDKDGNKIVQNMHFINRDVYSLRFDEDNCHSGCNYCNYDMFKNKNGIAYQRYYQFMITSYGEDAVAEMILAHRKINKLELTQLKTIIEHYSNETGR